MEPVCVSKGHTIEIHVIGDSTGDTAARVARAASAQFPQHAARIVKHPRIMAAAELIQVLEKIAATRSDSGPACAVFATLIDDELREVLAQRCTQLQLAHCDLLSPVIATLEDATGVRAERVPARPVGVGSDYFQRIDAMEFAVKHDDGQHPEGLASADIVLIGVSRTGKTPLSMYLGYLGYRTANIPLIADIAPPPQLGAVARFRIVGLTIDPRRLALIRSRRVMSIAPADEIADYADQSAIFEEIDQARRIQRTFGCPVIDTTTLALEEAARHVIDLVDGRRPAVPS